MQTEVNEWQQAAGLTEESISVADLDNLVKEYLSAREDYEAADKVKKEKSAILDGIENRLLNTLKAAGKKSYKVDGVGNAIVVHKSVIQVPKTVEAKRSLWDWINEKYGKEFLDEMLSINSQKLTAWYNQEAEKNKANPLFSIPGIDAPTTLETLSFRRER